MDVEAGFARSPALSGPGVSVLLCNETTGLFAAFSSGSSTLQLQSVKWLPRFRSVAGHNQAQSQHIVTPKVPSCCQLQA